MLYADFMFRSSGPEALCLAGWTLGPTDSARLEIGGRAVPAAAVLTHLRGDLPLGAQGFVMRFDLDAGLDLSGALLRMDLPDRAGPLPEAGLMALIDTAPDDLFLCLMVAVAEGMIALHDPGVKAHLHRRSAAIAAARGFAELPGAAVALDVASVFSHPSRVIVKGWMADDGSSAATHAQAHVLDAGGLLPVPLFREALARPDLAGAQLRDLKVGAASGYVAAGRLPRALGPAPVCLVSLVHHGMILATLRPLLPAGPVEFGREFALLRDAAADAQRSEAILAGLLPDLPDFIGLEGAEILPRDAEPAGLAYVVEHDLDPWLGRDVVRLLRRSEPGLRQVTLATAAPDASLVRAALADRAEAAGPAIQTLGGNAPLARWAPEAQHLVATSAALLFQVDAFALLSRARAEALPAVCLVLTERMESGIAPLSHDEGIEALLTGAPFLGQIDQSVVEPVILPQSLNLGPMGQMRWLLIALGRAGLCSFVTASSLGFLPGRDPMPAENRLIELRAMRRTALETVK